MNAVCTKRRISQDCPHDLGILGLRVTCPQAGYYYDGMSRWNNIVADLVWFAAVVWNS